MHTIVSNSRHFQVSRPSVKDLQGLVCHLGVSRERMKVAGMLAIQIERNWSKKQILETYLNQVYFGSRAYGVQAAAQTYFGRNVWQLNLPECAMGQ